MNKNTKPASPMGARASIFVPMLLLVAVGCDRSAESAASPLIDDVLTEEPTEPREAAMVPAVGSVTICRDFEQLYGTERAINNDWRSDDFVVPPGATPDHALISNLTFRFDMRVEGLEDIHLGIGYDPHEDNGRAAMLAQHGLDFQPDQFPGDGLDRQLWLAPFGPLESSQELPDDCNLSIDGQFEIGGNDDTLVIPGCWFEGCGTPDDPSTALDESLECGPRTLVGADADAICANAEEAADLDEYCEYDDDEQACADLAQLLLDVPALGLVDPFAFYSVTPVEVPVSARHYCEGSPVLAQLAAAGHASPVGTTLIPPVTAPVPLTPTQSEDSLYSTRVYNGSAATGRFTMQWISKSPAPPPTDVIRGWCVEIEYYEYFDQCDETQLGIDSGPIIGGPNEQEPLPFDPLGPTSAGWDFDRVVIRELYARGEDGEPTGDVLDRRCYPVLNGPAQGAYTCEEAAAEFNPFRTTPDGMHAENPLPTGVTGSPETISRFIQHVDLGIDFRETVNAIPAIDSIVLLYSGLGPNSGDLPFLFLSGNVPTIEADPNGFDTRNLGADHAVVVAQSEQFERCSADGGGIFGNAAP
ncbi:MAG: hypothetical protein AAGF11_47440 [Myxococcota bacterium]